MLNVRPQGLRSPLMRAKEPRSQAVHEMRGFLSSHGASSRPRRNPRAVQRSVLSPKCNTIQRSEAQREVEDSVGGKSLNLCEATESFGGRLEVVRTSSFALWDDSRPASRRGQTLSVTSRAVVLRFRHGERRQFLSRHPHLPQGAAAKAEQSLRDQVEEAAGAYRDPLYFAGAEPGRCRKGLP